MPPQQPDRLPDLVDGILDLSAHGRIPGTALDAAVPAV
jgi:hypothetical protein